MLDEKKGFHYAKLMKIWLKFLIGSVLGLIAGGLLPSDNQNIMEALIWLERLAIGIGRYALVPMVLFSLTIAVHELRQDSKFWPLVFQSIIVIVCCAALVIGLGILVTLLFSPSRIPILIEEQIEMVFLDTQDKILELFPYNMFRALTGDGTYLLPVYVFAFFLGLGLSYDRNYTKPVISMIDSLSRIFYHVASFFSEILALVMISLSVYWSIRFHAVLRAEMFRDLIVLLIVFSLVLIFGIFPFLLYFTKPKANPWLVLYGSLGQGLAGFFSGDINFTMPVAFRHVKENLGVQRRSNSLTLSLFTIFGRSGSAMTAAASFIVIINSYSSLGITTSDIITIATQAFLISFLLARNPGDGAYTALAALCLAYGRGYEAGYLILRPLAFFLISIGTFLDVMIASFASYFIARFNKYQEDKRPKHFI